jgi:hypothetical protein
MQTCRDRQGRRWNRRNGAPSKGYIADLRNIIADGSYCELMHGYQLDRLRAAAARPVRDARPQIQIIADALIEHGSLDADEIYQLVT